MSELRKNIERHCESKDPQSDMTIKTHARTQRKKTHSWQLGVRINSFLTKYEILSFVSASWQRSNPRIITYAFSGDSFFVPHQAVTEALA